MDKLNAFVVSHETQIAESEALQEWESEIAMGSIKERVCVSINLFNGVPVVPMALVTKESKSLISKLQDKVSDRVYALHRLVVVAYVPSVLANTPGVLNVKLYNRATGESIDVATDHPVSKAATFVSRWPRSVLAKAESLSLLFTATDVPTRTGSLIGTFHPFWEDKLSSKMVYEKQLPSLTYILEEQDPSHYVKNVSMLKTLMASKVLMGGRGVDLAPQAISLAPPSRIATAGTEPRLLPPLEQSSSAAIDSKSAPVKYVRKQQPLVGPVPPKK